MTKQETADLAEERPQGPWLTPWQARGWLLAARRLTRSVGILKLPPSGQSGALVTQVQESRFSLSSSRMRDLVMINGARATLRPQFSLALNYSALGNPSDLSTGWQVFRLRERGLVRVFVPVGDQRKRCYSLTQTGNRTLATGHL